MSAPRLRQYRFATPAQWQSGVSTRFDVGTDGVLQPAARFGPKATTVSTEPTDLIAVGPEGTAYLRARTVDDRRVVTQISEHDNTLPAFEAAGDLAQGNRWAVDRDAIWAFTAGTPRLTRTLRRSLRVDLEVDMERSVAALLEQDNAQVELLDVASDTRCGAWLLVVIREQTSADAVYRLIHLNANGCVISHLVVLPGAEDPKQLAVMDRGKTIVLLANCGKLLVFLEAGSGETQRMVAFSGLILCWAATRIASDGRGRLIAVGAAHTATSQAFIFSGRGDLLDGPFDAGADLTDVAIQRDRLWFASQSGVRVLRTDDGNQGSARELESSFMTPVLLSPETERGRGWLRAEIAVHLPPEGTLEADFAGTDDPAVAQRIRDILSNTQRDGFARMESAWQEFAASERHRYVFTGAAAATVPVAIPIFQTTQRWLVLRVRVIVPPGAQPPTLREIVVRYPDVSIAENLPAIFRGSDNDPVGVMRRMIGVLESTTQQLDARIGSIGSSLSAAQARESMLDYMAEWLGLPWDASLSERIRRQLLTHSPSLTAKRGTRAGLQELLDVLIAGKGRASISDLTADHSVVRLGGGECAGASLPVLVAGTRPTTATLGGKAVLGRARLPCTGTQAEALNPLASIVPHLRIDLTTDRTTQRTLAPLLEGLLRQFLPAGVEYSVRWHVGPVLAGAADGTLVLDDDGPAVLSSDRRLGRSTLGGSTDFVLH